MARVKELKEEDMVVAGENPVEVEAVEEIKKSKDEVKDIEDIPGVGPTSAAKLKAAGYMTIESIGVASPIELVQIAGLTDAIAVKAIQAARESLEMGFERGDEVERKRGTIGKVTTGSKALDTLYGGGVETQAITEVYGKFGSGKTQLGFQLAVNVQLPKEKGGLEGNALIVDTEHTFRPERIRAMAKAVGLDPDQALKNVFVARAYNSDHQMLLIDKAEEIIREKNIKVIIIDSLTAHFRSEYAGRGRLADRQQKLNRHMHQLQRFGDLHNIAVFVTNQVMSRPDILFGDPTAPIGGEVVAHNSTYRTYLRRSKETKRIAKLVDSPGLPDGEVVFSVVEEGIQDVEDE